MFIDFKVSNWKRLYFDTLEDFEKTLTLFENGEFSSIEDIESSEDLVNDYSIVGIDDTTEYLMPEDNDDQSTIEIYKNDELIWNNGDE